MMQPEVPEPGKRGRWGFLLKKHMVTYATYGNTPSTRVTILSAQPEVDKDYVKNQLRKDPNTNLITFNVINMVEENICSLEGIVKESDQDKLMERVKKTDPTLIILAYNHGLQFGPCPSFPTKGFYDEPPLNSVPWLLKKKGMVYKILRSSPTTLTISTQNVYTLENCLLSCTVPATGSGLIRELEEVLKENKIENKEDTRVMILSGGHGDNKDEKNNMTPVGGLSCFSDLSMLVYKFYEDDCKRIGVAAEPDPCTYHPTENTVTNIKQNVSLSKPEPMAPYAWPSSEETPLMQDERFNLIKFNVLNVGQFFKDPDGLVEYLTEYNPTFIIIGWSFSTNGDLSVALRSKGFFSKMLLEFDLRSIKSPSASLSDDQIKLLKKADQPADWAGHGKDLRK